MSTQDAIAKVVAFIDANKDARGASTARNAIAQIANDVRLIEAATRRISGQQDRDHWDSGMAFGGGS